MTPIKLRTHNGGTQYVFRSLADVLDAFDRAERSGNGMVRLEGRSFTAESIRCIEHGDGQVLDLNSDKPVRVTCGVSARTGRRPLPPTGPGGQRSGGVASGKQAPQQGRRAA